jgi:superfamily I DNA and RNA helicase
MIREDRHDTSVQVAVRIRPLSDDELEVDNIHYITADPAHKQVCLKTATHDINEL